MGFSSWQLPCRPWQLPVAPRYRTATQEWVARWKLSAPGAGPFAPERPCTEAAPANRPGKPINEAPSRSCPLIWTATALALVAVFLGFTLSGAIASSGTTRSQAAAALSDDVPSSPGQALSLPEKDARTVAWAVVDGVRHGDITVKTGRLLVAELRPLLGPAGPGSLGAQREQFDRLAETSGIWGTDRSW